MEIRTRQRDSAVVLDVSGRLTAGAGADQLRGTIAQLAGEGKKRVLLNLEEVAFMDSTGLGSLGGRVGTAAAAGRPLGRGECPRSGAARLSNHAAQQGVPRLRRRRRRAGELRLGAVNRRHLIVHHFGNRELHRRRAARKLDVDSGAQQFDARDPSSSRQR